jgi:hypothetical protein
LVLGIVVVIGATADVVTAVSAVSNEAITVDTATSIVSLEYFRYIQSK